jgi:hypothetical protein
VATRRSNGREPKRGLDLSIWGISDPELLGIVDDLADEQGWTHSYDVRIQLGENPDEVGRHSGVGQRLSWMRRYGWLERSEQDGRWRLTPMGEAILDHPDLSKAVENALAKMNPAQRVRLTQELAAGSGTGGPEIRTAIRRQWQRSFGR